VHARQHVIGDSFVEALQCGIERPRWDVDVLVPGVITAIEVPAGISSRAGWGGQHRAQSLLLHRCKPLQVEACQVIVCPV
jgi:hypothetical protein